MPLNLRLVPYGNCIRRLRPERPRREVRLRAQGLANAASSGLLATKRHRSTHPLDASRKASKTLTSVALVSSDGSITAGVLGSELGTPPGGFLMPTVPAAPIDHDDVLPNGVANIVRDVDQDRSAVPWRSVASLA